MRQQIGDPGRIVHVALAPGYPLDMCGVGQDLLETPFQHVPDRLPIDACGLHRHMRAAGLLQPIRKFQQASGRRRKPAHFIAGLPSHDQPKAGHYLLLVHVETRAAFVQCLHSRPPQGAAGVKPLLNMNSIHRAPGRAPAIKADDRRGHNYGCSKGLRSNSVTGSIAPSERQPRCRPRPRIHSFHRSGCASANGNSLLS
jgi:hypothetical protein